MNLPLLPRLVTSKNTPADSFAPSVGGPNEMNSFPVAFSTPFVYNYTTNQRLPETILSFPC